MKVNPRIEFLENMNLTIMFIVFVLIEVDKTIAFSLGKLLSMPNPLNFIPQNKCIEDLGCFYTGAPYFDVVHRPISLAPTSDVTVKYLLFTPANEKIAKDLEPSADSVKKSIFDPNLPTKMLIHGFLAEMEENDIWHQIKDALLNDGPYNIIILYWDELNGNPYPQAVANARAVGAQAAILIKLLMDNKGISGDSVHVIGHSLGGQMAGWIGEKVQTFGASLGRITGLDPAGPYFRGDEPTIHLDPTDADFVDVIHTDGGEFIVGLGAGLGISDPSGHLDFYPNGGREQPGCSTGSATMDMTQQLVMSTCDHGRAYEYFLESVTNRLCQFLAVKCESYEDFEKGICTRTNSVVSEMGFRAKKNIRIKKGSMLFLRTNSESPFCNVSVNDV